MGEGGISRRRRCRKRAGASARAKPNFTPREYPALVTNVTHTSRGRIACDRKIHEILSTCVLAKSNLINIAAERRRHLASDPCKRDAHDFSKLIKLAYYFFPMSRIACCASLFYLLEDGRASEYCGNFIPQLIRRADIYFDGTSICR